MNWKPKLGLLLVLTTQWVNAGISNGSSPYFCGESSRVVIQEKVIHIPNSEAASASAKVRLIKSLIGCAGAYGTASLKSAVSVELRATTSKMSEQLVKEIFIGNSENYKTYANAKLKVQLNPKMLIDHPLNTISYTNSRVEIANIILMDVDLYAHSAARDFENTKRLFLFEAELDMNLKHIADYIESATLQIEGLPAVKFELEK
jgi:hypothetical protein